MDKIRLGTKARLLEGHILTGTFGADDQVYDPGTEGIITFVFKDGRYGFKPAGAHVSIYVEAKYIEAVERIVVEDKEEGEGNDEDE